mgnify:CR=1 FL=1
MSNIPECEKLVVFMTDTGFTHVGYYSNLYQCYKSAYFGDVASNSVIKWYYIEDLIAIKEGKND